VGPQQSTRSLADSAEGHLRAVDGAAADAEGVGDPGGSVAVVEHALGDLATFVGHGGGSPADAAAVAGGLQAGVSALAGELALELGQGGEDVPSIGPC
jgi:hypothetical protein